MDGGLVDGNLYPDKSSIEVTHRSPATGRVTAAIIKLKVRKNGRYVRSAPFLNDEFSKQKYLIEVQFHSGGNDGFLFRGELGEPTVMQDENFGEIISIPCESIFRSIRETYISPVELRNDPQGRFIRIIADYVISASLNGGTILGFRGGIATTAIDLPGDSVLNRTWIPFGPTKVKKLLNEVIDILEDAPQVGGKLVDFFFDEEASLTTTRRTDIFAEQFGKNISGVIINPISFGPVGEGAEKDKKVNTDNIAYKNHIIAKGDARSGTTPPELQRFRSQLLNGQNRDIWDSSRVYVIGEGAKMQYPGQFPDERYFISLTDSNNGNTPAFSSNGTVDIGGNWFEDFTIDPDNTSTFQRNLFYSPNPWFSDLELARSNIVGKGNLQFQNGEVLEDYEGAFFDWNIERTLYDRPISNDFFERVSVKSVNERVNAPPLKVELYNGYRVILGTFGIDDPSIGPGFENMNKTVNADGDPTVSPKNNTNPLFNAFHADNRGRVLEYVGDPNDIQGQGNNARDTNANGWIVSGVPIDTGSSGQDTTTNLETMKILKWEVGAGGGARVDGDWIDAWDIFTGHDLPGTPFHIVKSTKLVDGSTGIPNQAFEARFEFKSLGEATRFEKVGGLSENRNSRGVWLSWIHPLPYLPVSPTQPTGDVCGTNRKFPFFDVYNLNRTCKGIEGWNSGLSIEELGGVTGVHLKIKSGWFTGENDEIADKAIGYENMPHVYWAMDKFGHILYKDFEQPGNNQWETHDLDFGVRASQDSFFSRFDELATLFGYTLPYNWFIPEREFTGKAFDMRFIKYQGVFSKWMYSEDSGHYLGAIEQGWKDFTSQLEQVALKTSNIMANIANLIPGVNIPTTSIPVTDGVIIDHTTIAIDEFCFITELYANADDGIVTDPRTDFVTFAAERDYLTLKARAKAHKARKQFFSQFWHMGSITDVRMKVGQKFTASGPEVPGGSKELICAEVKFTDNEDGSRMKILGVNEFVATETS